MPCRDRRATFKSRRRNTRSRAIHRHIKSAGEKLNMRGMKASSMTFRSWLEYFFTTFDNSLSLRTEVARLHAGKRYRVIAIKSNCVMFETADIAGAIMNLIQLEGQYRPIQSSANGIESLVAGSLTGPIRVVGEIACLRQQSRFFSDQLLWRIFSKLCPSLWCSRPRIAGTCSAPWQGGPRD